ncbi:MAG TPA: hypothetical protein VLF41_00085 [Candidatus Nanoarchaeia archaeon]|nr:hypothetical protein [Candidatus Nanoarchaeia archaeon]
MFTIILNFADTPLPKEASDWCLKLDKMPWPTVPAVGSSIAIIDDYETVAAIFYELNGDIIIHVDIEVDGYSDSMLREVGFLPQFFA